MRQALVRALLCTLVGAATLLPTGTLAAGPVPTAARPGGTYSVLRNGSRSAITVVEWARNGADRARLTFKASGLTPGKRYRLVGSSVSCGEPSPSSKRVFSKWFRVGSRGAAWLSSAPVDLLGDKWRDIRSTRLMEEEGIFYFCRSTSNFANTTFDDESADAAIAIVDAGNRHGIIILDNDGETEVARVRHDIQVGSDAAPRLVVRNVGCSQPATTQSILIALLLPLRGHGQTFGQQTVEVENDETHWVGPARSVRVRDAGSPAWDCDRPSIIAVLTGL